MATLLTSGPRFAIDGVNAYVLGGGKDGPVTLKVIQVSIGTAVGLSLTVKGRRAGSTLTPFAIPYRTRYLNGAVGDDSYVSTAITTNSIIEVNAAGLDVVLDVTALTSGIAQADYGNVTG